MYKIVTGHETVTIENPIIAAHITNPSDIDLYLNNGYMLVDKCKARDVELK